MMSFLKALISLVIALPELIKLMKQLEKRAISENKKVKVKEDVKKINQAFKDRDAEAIREIFRS